MTNTTKQPITRDEALHLLEEAKKLYAPYAELAKVCETARLAKDAEKKPAPVNTYTTTNTLAEEATSDVW